MKVAIIGRLLFLFGTLFLLNNRGDIIYRWDNVNNFRQGTTDVSFMDRNRQDWFVTLGSGMAVYTKSDALNMGTVWYKNSGVKQDRGEE